MNSKMTIAEALNEALEFLEATGYKHGDIHDNLQRAIAHLPRAASRIAFEVPTDEYISLSDAAQ